MSESDPVFSIPATSLKQYGKKKRRRDEAQAARDEPVESGKKKKRKHDEESGDTTSPVVQRDLDLQGPLDVAEKKKKKKKEEKRQHGAADDTSVPDEAHVSGVDATSGLEKKEKRKRDYTIPAAGAETGEEGDATGERKKKKKKKHHDAAAVDVEIGVQENEAVDTSTVALPSDAADPPVKKNKKSKEKRKDKNLSREAGTSSATAEEPSSHVPPGNDTLFPLPNYIPPQSYFPDPNMSLFPTPDALSFPDMAFGSNDDVLRALQDLDLTKIAGVLKTLTDAADAANVPLGIPSSSTPHVRQAPTASGSLARGSEKASKSKKHRRTLDMTLPSLPSSSSDPGHAHLLATKWMTPTKLAELVESEGLVYKKGKFSAIEIKQINEALENYRTSRGLSEEDVNKIIFPSDEKQKDATFWSEITSAVAQRPLIAVYHYLRRAHHPLGQQGKWSPEQDAKLIQAVSSFGQHWEKVGSLVGRMATDCRDRYRNYIVDREKRVAGTWTSAEEEELTRIVTNMQKGKSLDTDVFWGKVSERMGGKRSRQQCRIKWTDSLSKKFKTDGSNSRWSRRDAAMLIHNIDSLNVRDDTEIDWKSIQDSQMNLWSAHSLQRRWLTMKRGVKGFEDMSHPEIMDILRVKTVDITPRSPTKRPKSAKVVDSDDDKPRADSSTGPGTLEGDDSE